MKERLKKQLKKGWLSRELQAVKKSGGGGTLSI